MGAGRAEDARAVRNSKIRNPQSAIRNQPPRIAGISYLNSAPYFSPFRLGVIDAPFELELMTPAECNRAVADGRCDGGLISTIAWARLRESIRGLTVLPGFEIASDGEVGSISLYARGSWESVSRVAVTAESATSVEMLRILIADAERTAELVVADDPLASAAADSADGALLIGDAAMGPAITGFQKWDLGALWRERIGAPMVYAVFALRDLPDDEVKRIRGGLEAALSWSRDHLDAVIDEWYNRPSAVAKPAWNRAGLRSYLERLDAVRSSAGLGAGLEKFLARWNRVRAGSDSLSQRVGDR